MSGNTAGEKAYIKIGERGIRGEVMDGFPALRKIAVPTYKNALKNGKNKNDAGVLTLLHLILKVYDTRLYKRGGIEGVRYAQSYAEKILSSDTVCAGEIKKMDMEFTKKNLSPGGCADLLALTYFLVDFEEKFSQYSPDSF